MSSFSFGRTLLPPSSFPDASPDRWTILTKIPKQNLELTSYIYIKLKTDTIILKRKSAARLFKIPMKIGHLSTAIFFTLSPFCPKFYYGQMPLNKSLGSSLFEAQRSKGDTRSVLCVCGQDNTCTSLVIASTTGSPTRTRLSSNLEACLGLSLYWPELST